MAHHLAERGVDVVVTYKAVQRAAHEVASGVRAKGGKSAALGVALVVGTAVSRLVDPTAGAFPRQTYSVKVVGCLEV